jgi:hypothetical protein
MKHLTYANVAASLALFIALAGGTAFAASELGKESVDTKQLAKGAVTPSKLSKSSKKSLKGTKGAPGPQGPIGLPGAPGTPGKEGPRGINLEQVEQTATGSLTTVRTFNGVTIKDSCNGGQGELKVFASTETPTLQAFGSANYNGKVNLQDYEAASGFGVNDVNVSLQISVRNTAVDPDYSIVNLHMSGCELSGEIIHP